MNIWPWIYIALGYVSYIIIAVLTSVLARNLVGDLKDMQNRNSPRVLLMGAVANSVAMAAILLLLVYVVRQPIASLGLLFSTQDTIAAFGGLALTVLMAIGFLLFLRKIGRIQAIEASNPLASSEFPATTLGLIVLVSVVLQEEVLNRGYVTLNLLPSGPIVIIIASTVIFVLIHFLTNRANIYQTVSWVISGLALIVAYLLSGSIWVPVILHYATDATNVLVFNITGQSSLLKTTPTVTEAQRAGFRIVYGVAILAFLVTVYGTNFKAF